MIAQLRGGALSAGGSERSFGEVVEPGSPAAATPSLGNTPVGVRRTGGSLRGDYGRDDSSVAGSHIPISTYSVPQLSSRRQHRESLGAATGYVPGSPIEEEGRMTARRSEMPLRTPRYLDPVESMWDRLCTSAKLERAEVLTVLVIGRSGVGKTALVNTLFADEPSKIKPTSPFEHKPSEGFARVRSAYHGVSIQFVEETLPMGEPGDPQEEAMARRVQKLYRRAGAEGEIFLLVFVDRLDGARELNSALAVVTDTLGTAAWARSMVVLTHGQTLPPPDSTFADFVKQRRETATLALRRAARNKQLSVNVVVVDNAREGLRSAEGHRVLPFGVPAWANIGPCVPALLEAAAESVANSMPEAVRIELPEPPAVAIARRAAALLAYLAAAAALALFLNPRPAPAPPAPAPPKPAPPAPLLPQPPPAAGGASRRRAPCRCARLPVPAAAAARDSWRSLAASAQARRRPSPVPAPAAR
eukprot:tig00021493_g21873.t1